MKLICVFCKEEFEGSRRTRRYCSESHRKAASKARRIMATASDGEEKSGADPGDGKLVRSVESDLRKAGVEDSFLGQLAVDLARSLRVAEGPAKTAMSKELRTVMAAALSGAVPAADDEGDSVQPPDELERVRRAREDKARQAAGRT